MTDEEEKKEVKVSPLPSNPDCVTVVPQYLLIHSRTQDKCQNQQVLHNEAFSLAGRCHDSYKF